MRLDKKERTMAMKPHELWAKARQHPILTATALSALLCLVLLTWGIRTWNRVPGKGDILVRQAFPADVIQEVAGGDSVYTGVLPRLVADLMGRELQVTVEEAGTCQSVSGYYTVLNHMQIVVGNAPLTEQRHPVLLFQDPAGWCFGYTIEYSLPQSAGRETPYRISLIHPLEDLRYFRAPE